MDNTQKNTNSISWQEPLYRCAVNHLESGAPQALSEAGREFTFLGDYRNSRQMLSECRAQLNAKYEALRVRAGEAKDLDSVIRASSLLRQFSFMPDYEEVYAGLMEKREKLAGKKRVFSARRKQAEPSGTAPAPGIVSNPFYILQVGARDSDSRILTQAEDLKLLFGIDTTQARQALLHPNSRLDAEIRYLPGVPEEEIAKIRAYMEQILEEGVPGRRPEMTALPIPDFAPEGVLARLNGASALLSGWPVSDLSSAKALILTVSDLVTQLSPETVLQELNEDRKAGGRPLIPDQYLVWNNVKEHLHELAAELAARCAALSAWDHYGLRKQLAQVYCDPQAVSYRSTFLDDMVSVHLAPGDLALSQREQGIIERIMDEYRQDVEKRRQRSVWKQLFGGNDEQKIANWRKKKIDELCGALRGWDAETRPERLIARQKGIVPDYVDGLFEKTHSFFIELYSVRMDYVSAMSLICEICDVFTDVSQVKREFALKNKGLLFGKK